MILLCLGILLWSAVHLYPVLAPQSRAQIIEKIGFNVYRAGFSLLIVASIALMVFGFRSVEEQTILFQIYDLAIMPALILNLVACVLIAASIVKSNFSRTVRHPQLVGFSLLMLTHVLVNGELRTTVLFGGLLIWALASIYLINRRDGAFQKPKPELPHKAFIAVAIGFCIYIALILGHGYFTGVELAGGPAL